MMYLKGYQGPPRMVQVNRADTPMAPECAAGKDIVTVYPNRLVFLADHYTYVLPPELVAKMQQLNTYDIITIDDRGILDCVFEIASQDATIFITGKCNSNCVMCPTSDYERKKDGFDDDQLKKMVDMLPSDTPHIVVTGGEPTLRTNLFFRTMEQVADKFPNTVVLLLTNGRSFASLIMVERLLAHCPQCLTIAIPIHGANSQTHDAITQAPGSFTQTCLGLSHLLSRKVDIEIRVVVSRLNVEHLSEIADLIANRFPSTAIVNFIGLETRGNCAKNHQEVYIDCKDSFPYVRQAVNILVEHGINTSLYNYPLCAVDEGYRSLCKKSISPWKVRFPAACNTCSAKPYCGGLFDSTLSLAHPPVTPI